MSVLPALVAIALGSVPLSGGPQSNESIKAELYAKRILELTNAERFKLGRPLLQLNENLSQGAAWLAEDMCLLGYFDHQDSKERRPSQRAEAFGYTGWISIGENIAFGQPTPDEVFRGWMGSIKHRQNILDPRFKDMGIGYSTPLADPKSAVWVQCFGAKRSGGT